MYPQPQRHKTSTGARKTRAQNTAIKNCLITGFDGFGNSTFNPTQTVAGMLPNEAKLRGGVLKLDSLVLPTCCKGAWAKLSRRLAQEQPDLLLLCGLAQKRTVLSIERFALNVRDYRIEDNAGHKWDGQPIEKNGPPAFQSELPLKKLEAHLWKKGYPCEVSNHAGTFVCNDIYYRSLTYQLDHPEMRVLFLHVPLPGKFGKSILENFANQDRRLARSREVQMQYMMNGVIEAAQFLASLKDV